MVFELFSSFFNFEENKFWFPPCWEILGVLRRRQILGMPLMVQEALLLVFPMPMQCTVL